MVLALVALPSCTSNKTPELALQAPELSWISPSNDDGVQDVVTIPLTVLADKDAAITGYRISVTGPSGGVVRKIEQVVDPTKRGLVESLLIRLRIKRRTGVEVPRLVVWDGKDDQGDFVPDGRYTLTVAAWDHKNEVEAPPLVIMVDNTPPIARLSASLPMFSPNGDGRKDSLRIVQVAAQELRWTATLVDAQGAMVKESTWEGRPPSSWTWDGTDQEGRTVVDGFYQYRLVGTDLAGNRGTSVLDNLAVNTVSTPYFVSLSSPAFSPNSDRILDTMEIGTVTETRTGMEQWSLAIVDARSRVVFSRQGIRHWDAVSWPGTKDDGSPAPEGTYTARVEIEYSNGNLLSRVSDPFVVDTSPPQARVAPNRRIFSPDDDGLGDTVQFLVSGATEEETWTAVIRDLADGEVVRTYYWTGKVPSFRWDGKDEEGVILPDGPYEMRLEAADAAGNRLRVPIGPLTLDRRPTPVGLRTGYSGFSPNGDQVRDSMDFPVDVPIRDGILNWSFVIRDIRAATVATRTGGNSSLPETLTWDGVATTGQPAPEGRYTASLSVRYVKGNEGSASTRSFMLDTSPPVISLAPGPLPFSPDDDGFADLLRLNLSITDASPIRDWELAIRDREDNLFHTIKGIGSPLSNLTWNGLSASGERVLSAEDYPIYATTRDIYGNSTSTQGIIPVDILVLKEGNRFRIQVPGIFFAANSPEFPRDSAEANLRILTRLAEVLKKFPTYNISIEGNAARINWANPAKAEVEEREVLVPLSRSRAEKVRSILMTMGIDGGRMQALGLGGASPLVPHADAEYRWKNRRVDFVLVRQP